jgi:hypothetical protein
MGTARVSRFAAARQRLRSKSAASHPGRRDPSGRQHPTQRWLFFAPRLSSSLIVSGNGSMLHRAVRHVHRGLASSTA